MSIYLEHHASLLINKSALLSNFRSIICQVVAYGKQRTKENFKLLALKVVAVAYERWSLTRGSKYSDLNWKRVGFFENWSLRRGSRLREVIATRRFACIAFVS